MRIWLILLDDLDTATIEIQKSDEEQATETVATATTEVAVQPEVAGKPEEAHGGEELKNADGEFSSAAQTQLQQASAAGFVVVRIFGTFQASQLAQRRIQALVVQSIRGYNPIDSQMAINHRNSLNNITNHQVTFLFLCV
jgi:hypothetical protein